MSELDRIVEELNYIKAKVDRMERSPWDTGTVTAVDLVGRTVTVDTGGQTVQVGLPSAGVYLPIVGSPVTVMYNGMAPYVMPNSDRTITSHNYVPGVSGWAIDADGDAEFNSVLVRGIVEASTLEANTLSGSQVDLAVNGGVETTGPGTEILPNPGAEVNTAGWTAGPSTTLARSTTSPRTGVGRFQLTRNTTTGSASMSTPSGTGGFAVSTGETVHVEAWVRANSTGRNATLEINAYNAAGALIGPIPAKVVLDSSGAYQQLLGEIAIKPGWAFIDVTVDFGNCVATEIHFVDDVSLKKVTPRWASPLGDGARVTTQAFAGAASYNVPGNSRVRHLVSGLVEGAAYDLTFQVRTAAGASNIGLYIYNYAATGLYLALDTGLGDDAALYTYGVPAAWTQYTHSFRVQDGASSVEVEFWNTSATGIFIDGVVVKRATYFDGGYARPRVMISQTDVLDRTGLVMPVGAVLPWAGQMGFGYGWIGDEQGSEGGLLVDARAPVGWLPCAGIAVSRTTYWRLFQMLGTTFGVGDGSTTFNVPDLRGRVPVCLDNSGGTDAGRLSAANTMGGTGGEESHLLTGPESGINSHAHATPDGFSFVTFSPFGSTGAGTAGGSLQAPGAFTSVTGDQNADTAHNNMPPYILLNYIIKT